MTPQEALEHIKYRAFKDGPICHECAEANKILTELVYENSPRTGAEIREYVEQLIKNANDCYGVSRDPYYSGSKAMLEIVLAFIDGEQP